MKKEVGKRLLSIMLTLALVFTMMPMVPGAVLEVHAATLKDIDINITEPVVGQYTDKKGTVNNSDKYYVKCVYWYDVETGDCVSGQRFISGRTYKAQVTLTRNGNNLFEDEGINSLKINGIAYPPEVAYFDLQYGDDMYRQIKIEVFYTTPGPKCTGHIEIDGTRPTANQTPKYDFTLSNMDTSEYEIYGMEWRDRTAGGVMGSTDKFIAGHSYDLKIGIRGIDDNTFLPADELSSLVNGELAECHSISGAGDNEVLVIQHFKIRDLEGSGTKDDPYVVNDEVDFLEAFAFDGVYVKLGSDIDFWILDNLGIRVDATLDLNNKVLSIHNDRAIFFYSPISLKGPGKIEGGVYYYGNSKLSIDDAITIEELHSDGQSVVLNHPEAFVGTISSNKSIILEAGKLWSINDREESTLIMRDGIWKGGLLFRWGGCEKQNYALYGGRIDTTNLDTIFTGTPTFSSKGYGDYTRYLAAYGELLNTFCAFSLDGDVKKCSDMDDFISVAKEYKTFDVYAPYFAEQSPFMPGGIKIRDLGTIEATSYPITFKSNKLPDSAYENGFSVKESITVKNSNGEIVDSVETQLSKGGEGVSYDLKNLPAGKYTITEDIVVFDKQNNRLCTETNTFTVNWKSVYNISGSVSGVENTTKTDVEVYKYNSGRYEYMKKVTLTGNSSYQLNSLPFGNYKLVAKAEGYVEKSYQFRLESRARYNFTMELEKLTGNAFYTSGTSVGKAVNVSLGGNISSVSAEKRNYQWQISNNGTSGWTNISGATTNPWTIPADAGYVGKFIRVVVTADGYNGEIVSPAAKINKQTNMFEVPETPSLTKNTEGTSITIANYQNDQEYVVSTSSTPDWENDTKFTGATLTGLTTNTVYYVHARMAETNVMQAGYIVRTSNISLAKSVYLNGIDVVAEKTVAESGEVVKITINPVPGNATGFDGAKVYLSYGAKAKLYSNAACTSQILSGDTSYYTTVYLKGADAETVTVSAERSAGSGMPYMDNVKIEIADAEGNFAFGSAEISLNPTPINIPQGGTAIVDLYSYIAPEKPIANVTWTQSSGDDLNGLSFERIGDSNQYLVKASDTCSVGTGYYNITVNGTKQVNSLRVNVTADPIPVENVSVMPSTLTLEPEATYSLAALISPTNATSSEITWSSSDETIATVNAKGNVTAVALGSATITATVDGKTGTCTVTVVSEEYSIDVTNGIASVSKARPGEVITLIANEAPAGKVFDKWVTSDTTVVNASSDTTTFTMPEKNVTVTATYKNDGTTPSEPTSHLITVTDGIASKFKAGLGETITLTADEAPVGKVFDKWVVSGATVADETSTTTTFKMGYEDVNAEATYKECSHTYDNSCDITCNNCSATRSITHDYAAATCTTAKKCKVCGTTSGSKLGHSYTNACDTTCNRTGCSATRSITHDYAAATCTTAKKCKVCGVTSGSALGHSYDSGKVTKSATCTATGTKTYTCTVCSATKTETIAKKGHSYSSTYTVDKKATTSADGSKSKHCTRCDAKTSVTAIPKITSVKLSTVNYTYNGSAKKPTVTVKNSKGTALKSGTDYSVTYASGRTKIGKYKVTVKFKGNYSGSKAVYFEIGPKNPSSVKTTLYGYDDVKVSWSKVSGASGYKVYYKKSSASSWKLLKTTTSTSYKKANLSDGVKYDFKVVTYKKVNGNACENAGKTSSIYTLKKVAGVKAAKSSSKVKVSWTNISGETGYQISQSTSKTGTKIVATYATTSGKYKTVLATKGKTYYYKVRAYKVVGKTKIYGPWSSVVKYKR